MTGAYLDDLASYRNCYVGIVIPVYEV